MTSYCLGFLQNLDNVHILSEFKTHVLGLCLNPSHRYRKNTEKLDRVSSQQGPLTWAHEDRQTWGAGHVQPGEKTTSEDLPAAPSTYKEVSGKTELGKGSDGTRGKKHKLKHRRFRQDIRRKHVILWTAHQCNWDTERTCCPWP